MIVTRDGVTWDVDAPDDFWARMWPVWEQATLDVVDRFCHPHATMIDIGAWIGPVSLWAARRGPVLAVEPDPIAYAYLTRNVAYNHANVRTVEAALDDMTGRSFILPHSEDENDWGTSMTGLSDHGLEVQAYSLIDLLDSFSVDDVSLVKMDIEGGEVEVLSEVAPYCAEAGIPLLVATHEPWWTAPFDPAWLDGFDHVEGDWHGWGSVLCT